MQSIITGQVVFALLLISISATQVIPSKEIGGCNDVFFKVGDASSGPFWIGPQKQRFCKVDGEYRFIIDGICTNYPISCNARQPQPVPLRAKTAKVNPRRSFRERHVKNRPPTFLDSVRDTRRRLESTNNTEMPVRRMKNMVLMIKFKDHDITSIPPVEDYDKLFNSLDGPDGRIIHTQSIKEFYNKQSNGLFELTNVLSGWIDVDYTEAEAAGSCWTSEEGTKECCFGTCGKDEMLTDAIKQAIVRYEKKIGGKEFQTYDGDLDGYIDMFTVIHSGFGAESTSGTAPFQHSIWSHKFFLTWKDCARAGDCLYFKAPKSGLKYFDYNINPGLWYTGDQTVREITRFGVIAHEMGHFLGLPDLYDSDFSSRGLGPYCLMANSWGLDQSQNYPPSFSAVAKYLLGWVQVEELYKGCENKCNKTVILPDIHTEPKIAKITFSNTEYYLIENRQAKENDSLMAGGMLIFHVDENKLWLGNEQEIDIESPEKWPTEHPSARLIQPDNFFDLELSGREMDCGDWFPYFLKKSFGDNNLPHPNINRYQFLGKPSGISISEVSPSADSMTFRFTSVEVPGTAAPTSSGRVNATRENLPPRATSASDDVRHSRNLDSGTIRGSHAQAWSFALVGILMARH